MHMHKTNGRCEMFRTGWIEEINKQTEKAIHEIESNIRAKKVSQDKGSFWKRFVKRLKGRSKRNAKANAR